MNQQIPSNDPGEIEERLKDYYHALPSPEFSARLRAQLRTRAGLRPLRRAFFIPPGLERAALGVTIFLALVGLVALGLQLRPQPAQIPGGDVSASITAPTPVTPASTPVQATEAAADVPLVVSPRLCNLMPPTPTADALSSAEHSDPYLYLRPAQPLNPDSAVTSGDFRFELLLYCDITFVHLSEAVDYSHTSEIKGLGIYAAYDYLGSETMEGETAEISGFVPYVRYSAGSGPDLGPGSGGRQIVGIDFPDDVLVDFSGEATPLRFIYKVQDPQGNFAGASLNFTLLRESDGYSVTDIVVQPLTGDELTGEVYAAVPLPTRDTGELDNTLAELKALLERTHSAQLDQPGWLHIISHMTNKNDGGTLPNGAPVPSEYTMDAWYLLGEQRKLLAAITIARYADESLNQVTVYQDGEWKNLTLNSSLRSPGARLTGVDGDLYASAVRAVRSGDSLTREVVEGGIQYTIETEQYRNVALLDAASGMIHWTEAWQLMPEGWERFYRMENLIMEHADQPPADVLALMDMPVKEYQPLPPQGTPAPAGFDPANSALRLVPIAGDDFIMPTFWFGDIYAGEYLLGRVEFGDVPGGHCQRSADGARIAFQYQPHGGDATLRWLDLRNVGTVHDPLPDLRLLSVPVWSPVDDRLLFAGCTSQSDCQTYVLDVESGAASKLSDLYSPWDALWKPDGSQVALVTVGQNNQQHVVVLDAVSGAVLYNGATNYPDVPVDSPVAGWGVAFPKGSSGFGGCE